MTPRVIRIILPLCIALGLLLGGRHSVRAEESRLPVFVSIVPQVTFVQRVGGERVRVQALVRPGASPATYDPTPRQMAALSQAKLYFRIGVPFENGFLPKIEQTMRELRIVDTREGIELRRMEAHAHHEEPARHEEESGKEAGADPHIWLSPRLVKTQARTIADALIESDPAGKDLYETNYAAFAEELGALDARLAKALAPVKGSTFLVFHPSWGYFADAYGLRQEAVEIEGKAPGARQLARIVDRARKENVRVIFVQPQFSRTSAQAVARAIDGAVVPIDPLAEDYVGNLQSVAETVAKALRGQTR